MLNFSFNLPTKVIHGTEVVSKNAAEIAKFGRKAFLVTGKSSARLSGALADVEATLNSLGIEYKIFDQVLNNPTLDNVAAGGKQAREYQPDFIIAIGGGSPLDAAKAVAVLAVNDIEPQELYTNDFAVMPLPIIAIPTTAGTGSEVTPYSVLTLEDLETKKSFSTQDLFPKIAFLDWRYTASLSRTVTIDTAVDALSHLVEGYLSRRANDTSDLFAKRGIKLWGECIEALVKDRIDGEIRDKLLVASLLGGFTISHTGTTFVHALGYPLTYFQDLPHGRANGLVIGQALKFTQTVAPERVRNVLTLLGLESLDQLIELLNKLFPEEYTLTKEEARKYAARTAQNKNVQQSLGEVTEEVLYSILKTSFTLVD
ncbi:MAG: iron-containing alcohol dehydrogenase [Firmicutes bacterium]|nr:iron-containing alcohol dehydrogenase [Bacillota bacterium]